MGEEEGFLEECGSNFCYGGETSRSPCWSPVRHPRRRFNGTPSCPSESHPDIPRACHFFWYFFSPARLNPSSLPTYPITPKQLLTAPPDRLCGPRPHVVHQGPTQSHIPRLVPFPATTTMAATPWTLSYPLSRTELWFLPGAHARVSATVRETGLVRALQDLAKRLSVMDGDDCGLATEDGIKFSEVSRRPSLDRIATPRRTSQGRG